ncbi:FeoB-associated Cys-rich membrane protein [Peptostreptococcaceae bacterium OttesenSCG-928-C18]|nr:FeoB-associated Cys-rich membrane protein [Peptostreptococcaceae bacterium OttesenSCG-928-C18]
MIPTIIILGIILIAVIFAIKHVKKKGTSCECGCGSCPSTTCSSHNIKK